MIFSKRKSGIMMAIVLSVILNSNIVYAASTIGGTFTSTVWGYTYKYYNSLITGDNHAQASTSVHSVNGVNIPAGYMGANAVLYNESGNLILAGDRKYNSNAGTGITVSTYCSDNGNKTYYSQGYIFLYNGNGYTTKDTAKSPYAQTYNLEHFDVQVNANNEVYGSAFELSKYNIEPDLISAVGNDGCVGYVKATDLELKQPANPEEATAYMEKLPSVRNIPLYDSDGETVVGSFTIHND